MSEIRGTLPAEFDQLGELLDQSLEAGTDIGASLSVTIEGEMVVDIWGGWVDAERTARWERDTITNVWSSTKTMTALAALVLVERGLVDLDAAVSEYWPEFAQNGKEGVLVRHLLGHTSGVAGFDPPSTVEDLYDWDLACGRLAAQAPWWAPGTASGYHALVQGHLVGEVVRRVDGRKLGRFFADEIAAPLGADFHIGLDPSQFHRVSNVIPPGAPAADLTGEESSTPRYKTFTSPRPDAEASWTPEWRQADIGAANGHGNARSIARIQALVANGGSVDGVELLSPETIALIFDTQAEGIDLVLGGPAKFGVGYGLWSAETLPFLPERRLCYWGGWGGSLSMVDVDRRISIGFAMNLMAGDPMTDARAPFYAATILGD